VSGRNPRHLDLGSAGGARAGGDAQTVDASPFGRQARAHKRRTNRGHCRRTTSARVSGRGAKHWANIASLVKTYKLDVDPLAYLTDVLARIVYASISFASASWAENELTVKTWALQAQTQANLRENRARRANPFKTTFGE
jgi:hypothetical protein